MTSLPQTNLCILVTGSPSQSQAHLSALRFIRAALKAQQVIKSVFFYQDGVLVANSYTCKPSDELNLIEEWTALSEAHNFELQVCVAASNRRGVINQTEAQLNQINGESLHQSFQVLGLGQLAAAMSAPHSQLIQFK